MLRIAICDDDQKDRDRVEGLVKKYIEEKNIEAQLKVFDHPDDLIAQCEDFRPHIFILDIVMPMLSGIEAARELRWNLPDAQIIFATSESSYALESFDVNPINYILKPVGEEKLFTTLDMAISRVGTEDDKTLTVKVKGGLQTMRLDDVLYIDYSNHVVTYHLKNEDAVSTPTLRIGFTEYMDNNHPGKDFVRCHESIAVNVGAIDKLSKTELVLRNEETIPVSKSRYREVADAYMDFRL